MGPIQHPSLKKRHFHNYSLAMTGVITYNGTDPSELIQVLKLLRARPVTGNRPAELEKCDRIILTGAVNAAHSMDELRGNDLDAWLKATKKPILAICLGMQLLYETLGEPDAMTESGAVEGLGLMPGTLKKFNPDDAKIPHMGWKRLQFHGNHPLTNGINQKQFLYYIHDYYAIRNEYTLATSCYIKDFAAIVAKDNVMGTQFHPEKSGAAGSHILQNFLEMSKNALA